MKSDFYRGIIEKWCPQLSGREALVCTFDKVRDIPYGSTGERKPEQIIQQNLGSCSGKHLLLSHLFTELGYENRVLTCLHHFNDALPAGNTYPPRLIELVENYRILDFHHYIKLKKADRWLDVDATWDATLVKLGFPANTSWDGTRDTRVAVTPIKYYDHSDDLIFLKERLIAELPFEDRQVRAEFMKLLTEWLKKVRT
jgi:hypothetical protein